MADVAVLSSPRKENVCMAKLAKQVGRYEEVIEIMENVADEYDDLTVEERNILFVAYKKVICARLASFRIIFSIEQESSGNGYDASAARAYRSKLQSEISSIFDGILRLLESKLTHSVSAGDSYLFYLKMKADFLCYLAHFSTGAEREEASERALSTYKLAQDIAIAQLAPTNLIRLRLALNFAVFCYLILKSRDRACELAQQAYDEANEVIMRLNKLEMETYKDSDTMVDHMRRIVSSWRRAEESDEDFQREMMEKIMQVP